METPQPHPQDYAGNGYCGSRKLLGQLFFLCLCCCSGACVSACRFYCALPTGTTVFVIGLADCGSVLVQFIEQPVRGRRTLSHHTTQLETGQKNTQRHREASYEAVPRLVCKAVKSNKEHLNHRRCTLSSAVDVHSGHACQTQLAVGNRR